MIHAASPFRETSVRHHYLIAIYHTLSGLFFSQDKVTLSPSLVAGNATIVSSAALSDIQFGLFEISPFVNGSSGFVFLY